MRKRAAFITIGASPRPDILDEMRPWWKDALNIEEHGALDGLTRAAIDELAPSDGEARLVSRVADGGEIVLGEDWVHGRIAELVQECDTADYDFLVLLCTGKFEELHARTLLLKAQPIVDHGVAAFAARRNGTLVPHAEQMADIEGLASYASPYDGDRFEEAAKELADAELIIMHCMGYTEAMRAKVADVSGRPVLLARRLLASAVAQLV